MKTKFFFSILPLILLFACSMEDPESGPPAKAEDADQKDAEDTEPPSVPQDLQVLEVGYESLTLTWKASADNDRVDRYLVYLNEQLVAEPAAPSSILSGMNPGEEYSLAVAAVDASGNTSQRSTSLEARTAVDSEPPGIPTGLKISNITQTSAELSWEASTDNAGIREYEIFLNGKKLGISTGISFAAGNLESATKYAVKIAARDIYGNISEHSEPLEFSTLSDETTPPESTSGILFISEYIEGSSYNKALEIANNSGSEVDLSSYSLKKISNENEDWTDEKPLEGMLAPGEVFVLAHSKASPEILAQADLLMGGGFISFNGNDTVGLFKDGELIDIIGATGGEDFAKDVTLRRKTTSNPPSPTFDPEDWEKFDIDTTAGLGNL